MEAAIRDHKAWLGYLQPDGLVVSPAALVDSQVLLDQNTARLQQRFLGYVGEVDYDLKQTKAITDLKDFLCSFLEWPQEYLADHNEQNPIPEELKIPLREFGEILEPDFAFGDPNTAGDSARWLLLVKEFPVDTDLDKQVESAMAGWSASHTRRMERLLRETEIPIGLISNGTQLRLIYAPRGENSGTLTFKVSDMTEVAGRPILAAFEMLLSRYRLLAAPTEAKLPALLKRSRDYQARVSTTLAQQVLDALYELLRGFQAADGYVDGELLRDTLEKDPDSVYSGLLTVLLRTVFLLYAEDRGLMPGSSLYVGNYSVHSLFERLRTDAEHYPDTMDHRYGAWAQLLALFRSVHGGCKHPHMDMPARSGYLFDPDRSPFLEGKTTTEPRIPLVSDGTIYRVLSNLLILDGERLSYRTLDVEEIGSVYQTIMGFRLEITSGLSIAVIGKRKHKGEVPAPNTINLEELLGTNLSERKKWLKDRTDQELTGAAERNLQEATSLDDLLAALERKIAYNATPYPVPRGGLVLQPTEERRRTGSHYTPRSFTEPIVRTTLRPILERLGEHPTPEQLLDLKIADVAVGSAAFLVEACRQLGDELVTAWHHHGQLPVIPRDEDEVLHARRIIAQRCLYGLDRNPMAVDLAKLSLWLATLARNHPFTFLDHTLRCGDSLVGLTKEQITGFHWIPSQQQTFLQKMLQERIKTASDSRQQILAAGDDMLPSLKQHKLRLADDALDIIRTVGDLVVAAFFSGNTARQREQIRSGSIGNIEAFIQCNDREAWEAITKSLIELRQGEHPVTPFHWEIELPEVFSRENPGFDAIIGNPPFMGGTMISTANGIAYKEWLYEVFTESGDRMDLVAYFFRRAFALLRGEGALGLLSTNTIAQGDTRKGGLRHICTSGGTIYAARRRVKWPGQAAVVVSVVHIAKGEVSCTFDLDGRSVPTITAYLFHAGGHENPAVLRANEGKSFVGSCILGTGFTFDDTDTKGVANPIALMKQLIARDPRNANRILPYIGGEEVNDSPTHAHHRFIISFNDFPLRRDQLGMSWSRASSKEHIAWMRTGVVPDDYPGPVAADWPDLLSIVEAKVKPERAQKSAEVRRFPWWRFWRLRPDMGAALQDSKWAIVCCLHQPYWLLSFLPTGVVYSHALGVFPYESTGPFAVLQSRVHEVWARFFASSMKDDLRYTTTDCFETFPFPDGLDKDSMLVQAGREYCDFRASLMVRNNEGLTKTYNRFHYPEETSPDILCLHKLHANMDRVVLDAYGWKDIPTDCEFLLEYEDEDEDEAGTTRRRKKPWRYRWPDDVRDEVLARLLKLNAERAEEERRTGEVAAASKTKKTRKGNTKRKKIILNPDQGRLI